jgi:hypothetical protein
MMENTALRHVSVEIVFLLDGAPHNPSRYVHAFVDRKLLDRWVGRGGMYSLVSHSSHLTPLDFSFAGL